MNGIFSSLFSDNIDLQNNVVKDTAKSDFSGQSQCVFKSVFPGWVTSYLVGIGHMSSLNRCSISFNSYSLISRINLFLVYYNFILFLDSAVFRT